MRKTDCTPEVGSYFSQQLEAHFTKINVFSFFTVFCEKQIVPKKSKVIFAQLFETHFTRINVLPQQTTEIETEKKRKFAIFSRKMK